MESYLHHRWILIKVQFIQDSTLFKVLVLTGFIVLGNSIIVKALIQLSIGLRTCAHQFLTFKVPQGANHLILCTLDTMHRLFFVTRLIINKINKVQWAHDI
jgi:hypothetical protein